MTKENFNKLWSESSKEDILNQYYYDYTYAQVLKQSLIDIKEYVTKDIQECTYRQISKYQEILEIIDKGLGGEK